MSIICYRVKRNLLKLDSIEGWILVIPLRCLVPLMSEQELTFSVRSSLFAPHRMLEEQILLAAFEHIKHPVSLRTTLEPCKPASVHAS